eukprot:gene28209-36401_t
MTSTSNGGGETYLNKAVEIVISSIPGAKIRSPLPSSFNDYLPAETFLFQYTVPCSFKVSAPIMARRSSSRSSQGVPISYLYKGSGEAEELRENDNDGGDVEDVNETPPHVGAMDRRCGRLRTRRVSRADSVVSLEREAVPVLPPHIMASGSRPHLRLLSRDMMSKD